MEINMFLHILLKSPLNNVAYKIPELTANRKYMVTGKVWSCGKLELDIERFSFAFCV